MTLPFIRLIGGGPIVIKISDCNERSGLTRYQKQREVMARSYSVRPRRNPFRVGFRTVCLNYIHSLGTMSGSAHGVSISSTSN